MSGGEEVGGQLGVLAAAEVGHLTIAKAPRAYTLAALAVEECGKALRLIALAVLPKKLRTRAPVGRMLEWDQLKQVGGLLVAAVPIDGPGMAAKLAGMPATQASQITEAELTSQLARARHAAASAALVLGPDARARLTNPVAEMIELATALVHALAQPGVARTPEAAADIMLNAVNDLRDSMASARRRHRPGRRSSAHGTPRG